MQRRIAVRGIITQGEKIFCARLKPYRHADALEYWCTPGGGVDLGGALIPALEREIFEELGIKASVGNLLYVQQYVHKDIEQLEFFFHITNAEDFLTIDLSKTTHGATEIEEAAFINPKQFIILPKFLSTEPFENLESQPVKIFNYLS